MAVKLVFIKGGKGSGFRGHTGLPGVHGGSRPRGGSIARLEEIAGGDPESEQTQAAKRVLAKRAARAEGTQLPLLPKDTYVTLFHATHDEFVDSIKEEGLILGREWMGRPPSVYFVETLEEAQKLINDCMGGNETRSQVSRATSIIESAISKAYGEGS